MESAPKMLSPTTSSAPSGHDSGCCKGTNLPRPTVLQHVRARVQRCACRAHIVDDDDDLSRYLAALLSKSKCAPHVAVSFGRRKIGLRRRAANPPQPTDDR